MRNQCVPSAFPTNCDPPGPETRNPATAATGQGDFAGGSEDQRSATYQTKGCPAITRYTVSADLLVMALATIDRALS